MLNIQAAFCTFCFKPKVSEQLQREVPKHTEDVTTAGNSLSEACVSFKQQEPTEEDQDAREETKTNQNNSETEKSNPAGHPETNDGTASIDNADHLENTGLCKGGTNETAEEGKKPEKGKKYRIK